MQKSLSKKSHQAFKLSSTHKYHNSSVEDLMKHIKKYNMNSERYLSPKPLLYLYNASSKKHHTLHTLQSQRDKTPSRSKSRTLSNNNPYSKSRSRKKQHPSKKSPDSRKILEKVSRILSLDIPDFLNEQSSIQPQDSTTQKNFRKSNHKKTPSQPNFQKQTLQQTNKKQVDGGRVQKLQLKKSTAKPKQDVLIGRGKKKIKQKSPKGFMKTRKNYSFLNVSNEGNQKEGTGDIEDIFKPKLKYKQQAQNSRRCVKTEYPQTEKGLFEQIQSLNRKLDPTNRQASIVNPGDLIEAFSKKLKKAKNFLAGKSSIGQMVCETFTQMLSRIVDSFVSHLGNSLQDLELTVEKRVKQEYGEYFRQQAKKHQAQLKKVQQVCLKLTKKTAQLMQRQNYCNQLIYFLRNQGIDVDRAFGLCLWKRDDLGGRGYDKQTESEDYSSQLKSEEEQIHSQDWRSHELPIQKSKKEEDNIEEEQYVFRPHPKQLHAKPMYCEGG